MAQLFKFQFSFTINRKMKLLIFKQLLKYTLDDYFFYLFMNLWQKNATSLFNYKKPAFNMA